MQNTTISYGKRREAKRTTPQNIRKPKVQLSRGPCPAQLGPDRGTQEIEGKKQEKQCKISRTHHNNTNNLRNISEIAVYESYLKIEDTTPAYVVWPATWTIET